MKKVIVLLIVCMMIFSMSACSGDAEKGISRLEEIKQRGYIEVATEPAFAPYEFIDPTKQGDEQYVGMDMEIAKYIADKLSVELKIVPLEFGAVLTSVTEGKYDIAISALAYTPARAENMNMSDGYYFSSDGEGYGFVVREEDLGKYIDAESVKNAVIVTQSGSIQELFVNEQIPNYKEFKRVSSMPDGFLMVSENKADVCACAIDMARLYCDANPGLAVVEDFRFEEDETTQGTRIGIPLGEDELTEFVNECIAELRSEGKIDEWFDFYTNYASELGIK